MMKRETLNNKRRNIDKMSYYAHSNTLKEIIDSHLEAYDLIDQLKVELELARLDRSYE